MQRRVDAHAPAEVFGRPEAYNHSQKTVRSCTRLHVLPLAPSETEVGAHSACKSGCGRGASQNHRAVHSKNLQPSAWRLRNVCQFLHNLDKMVWDGRSPTTLYRHQTDPNCKPSDVNQRGPQTTRDHCARL